MTNEKQKTSLIAAMSAKFSMEPKVFMDTLKATIFPGDKKATNEQVAAFLSVAKEYSLNPFVKEIYAFPSKGGGITPIVGVDGWADIVNSHPQFDGTEFTDNRDEDGMLVSITCKMHRKDREHPTEATEYLSECKRHTEPWNKWPHRMLRHKAYIQAARYAFGFAGIYDLDEAERIQEAEKVDPTAVQMEGNTKDKAEELSKRLQDAKEADFVEETAGSTDQIEEPTKDPPNQAEEPVSPPSEGETATEPEKEPEATVSEQADAFDKKAKLPETASVEDTIQWYDTYKYPEGFEEFFALYDKKLGSIDYASFLKGKIGTVEWHTQTKETAAKLLEELKEHAKDKTKRLKAAREDTE